MAIPLKNLPSPFQKISKTTVAGRLVVSFARCFDKLSNLAKFTANLVSSSVDQRIDMDLQVENDKNRP